MSEQLKPCPFCGVPPKHGWEGLNTSHAMYSIRCGNLDCTPIPGLYAWSPEAAAEIWNRRYNEPEQEVK